MAMINQEANFTVTSNVAHGFDCSDAKGRSIGMLVSMREFDVVTVPTPEGGYSFTRQPAGHYFAANAQVTRNGRLYGAGNSYKTFTTVAERDAWIAKRVADGRKYAAKKAA